MSCTEPSKHQSAPVFWPTTLPSKMKYFCVIALALVGACVAEDTYSSENDDLDIAAVATDQNTLLDFTNCFIDKGECTPVTADFKKDMVEAVEQACAKCTPAQKHIFRVFLEALREKLPKEYNDYRKKYDPENKYFAALLAAVANA